MTPRHEYLRASNDLRQVTTTVGIFANVGQQLVIVLIVSSIGFPYRITYVHHLFLGEITYFDGFSRVFVYKSNMQTMHT